MPVSDADKYQAIIDQLIETGSEVSPSLRNSACPTEREVVLKKFLDAGINSQRLTDTVAAVFDLPVYQPVVHGPPTAQCPGNQWLIARGAPSIFFVANPFLRLSPAQVLEQPQAKRIHQIGLLPVSVEKLSPKGDIKTKADSERQIEAWLSKACEQRASDIHITPMNAATVRISFRIDGGLMTHADKHVSLLSDDTSLYRYISNTLLRMCGLEGGVFTRPLDGKLRWQHPHTHESIDIRLAMRPTSAAGMRSQSFFLRLLRPHTYQTAPIDSLGLAEAAQGLLEQSIAMNQNLVLLTGPTGSGKTTTLYASLLHIQRLMPEKSIQTLEDPIEQHMEGIAQTQINPAAGMSFADGIRSLMRTDVDVILIGEIRDEATAKLAIRASLTGHLVLATVHCRTALDAIGRMLDFGVSSQLLSMILSTSFAQRLVPRSDGTGRCLVSEALPVTSRLCAAIGRGDYEAMHEAAEHAVTLWQHATQLIKSGEITPDAARHALPGQVPSREIIRVVSQKKTGETQ